MKLKERRGLIHTNCPKIRHGSTHKRRTSCHIFDGLVATAMSSTTFEHPPQNLLYTPSASGARLFQQVQMPATMLSLFRPSVCSCLPACPANTPMPDLSATFTVTPVSFASLLYGRGRSQARATSTLRMDSGVRLRHGAGWVERLCAWA